MPTAMAIAWRRAVGKQDKRQGKPNKRNRRRRREDREEIYSRTLRNAGDPD
ncbi:MAG: hypothetical protein GX579_09135 [Chloroflexi bacterium]|nr:hypothetical protein [Chloroflexota bacterium]